MNKLLGSLLIERLPEVLNLNILYSAQGRANNCREEEKPDNLLLVVVKIASWYKLRSYHLGIPRDLLMHRSIFRLESFLVILHHDFDKVPGPNHVNVFFHLWLAYLEFVGVVETNVLEDGLREIV